MPEVVATYTSIRAAQEHAASLNLTRLPNELFVVRTIGEHAFVVRLTSTAIEQAGGK